MDVSYTFIPAHSNAHPSLHLHLLERSEPSSVSVLILPECHVCSLLWCFVWPWLLGTHKIQSVENECIDLYKHAVCRVCKGGVYELMWLCRRVLWACEWRQVCEDRHIKPTGQRENGNGLLIRVAWWRSSGTWSPPHSRALAPSTAVAGGAPHSFWVAAIKDRMWPSQSWPNLKNEGPCCRGWRHWQNREGVLMN